ncbi:MAG: AmmeMemoRadiSam system protein B, partial [Candidatus ainarchaeum sp.]|nr:AmmeMemoRadiSam system protein B [Candidatus ainarchaeum sp.]
MREAKYAGLFYPKEKNVLEEKIRKNLKENISKKISGKVKAIIVPHAGYDYSAPIASTAYNLIKEKSKKQKFEKIVLIGPSHQEYFVGALTFEEDWETPLGIVKIVPAKLKKIVNDFEHSLEVQLPFLQTILKNFFLIPIIYSKILPQELLKIIPKNDLIVVSSDFSHYLKYTGAVKKDLKTIEYITKLDFENILKKGDACGLIGIATIVLMAKKNNWKPILLNYRNS